MQTFLPNSFIPAFFLGSIALYHFIPLSVALILVEGQKVSIKQNLVVSVSLIILVRVQFDMMFKQFKLNSLIVFYSDILLIFHRK